ncbi:hypothetical protein [uncultured Alloprevotella sp.]|uniref:hypothetical protein n=1 Tax=uncultured Alloprevotella sp. TaxID=1283315 RepID=UPI00325F9790
MGLVGVRTCPSQLRLVELRQSLRAGGVGDAEAVVYRIITVLVLHQLAVEKAVPVWLPKQPVIPK